MLTYKNLILINLTRCADLEQNTQQLIKIIIITADSSLQLDNVYKNTFTDNAEIFSRK